MKKGTPKKKPIKKKVAPKRKEQKKLEVEIPEDAPMIVATRAEVATELKGRIGKGTVRTLADWFKQGCPNEPGAYNVDAIENWVLENVGAENGLEQATEAAVERAYWNTVKIREQALKAQAERLLLEGKLVDAEEITRLIERLAGTLLSMLGQWPDWVLSLLPGEVKPEAKKSIRKKVGSKVDELGNSIADMLSEWSEAPQK